MISRVRCHNYRSLADVDVPFGSLTAIVGPNGCGKTALLQAVNLVLGQAYPSLRSIRVPQDFTNFDATQSLTIAISFDPPLVHEDALGTEHPVPWLEVTCAPYKRSGKWGAAGDLHLDFSPRNAKGDEIMVAATAARKGQRPAFRPLTVSSGLRDQARVLFIDHRRSVAQHLPSMRGSALGRLFEPARREFQQSDGAPSSAKATFAANYEAAMEALRTSRVQQIEATVADTAKRMIGFLGGRVARTVDIGFGFADPTNPFASLRLVYREGDLEVPGEELGLGVQSALVVGVFEALRQLGDPIGTVVIEEPEMYLHPQAQRYFHRLLTDLADGAECQIIYSSHSPIFADATRFEAVRLVRRPSGRATTVSYVTSNEDRTYLTEQRAAQKLATWFDPARSELLFASQVLLVEGPSDRLAVKIVADRLGLDLDAEGVAVVECGSKSAILFYARSCRAFGIPFSVLCDEDKWPEEGEPAIIARIRRQNTDAAELHARVVDAVGDPSRLFVITPTLEAVFGVGRSADGKPARVATAATEIDLESMPQPLIAAVKALVPEEASPAIAEAPGPEPAHLG